MIENKDRYETVDSKDLLAILENISKERDEVFRKLAVGEEESKETDYNDCER